MGNSSSDDNSSVGSHGRKHSGLSRSEYKAQRRIEKAKRKQLKYQVKLQQKLDKYNRKHGQEYGYVNYYPSYGKNLLAEAYQSSARQVPVATEATISNPVPYAVPVDSGDSSVPPAASVAVPGPTYSSLSIKGHTMIQALQTHDVDESKPEYKAHGIIRLEKGEFVELLDGTLRTGLPAPYTDYVLVKTRDNRVGKVGRLCFV